MEYTDADGFAPEGELECTQMFLSAIQRVHQCKIMRCTARSSTFVRSKCTPDFWSIQTWQKPNTDRQLRRIKSPLEIGIPGSSDHKEVVTHQIPLFTSGPATSVTSLTASALLSPFQSSPSFSHLTTSNWRHKGSKARAVNCSKLGGVPPLSHLYNLLPISPPHAWCAAGTAAGDQDSPELAQQQCTEMASTGTSTPGSQSLSPNYYSCYCANPFPCDTCTTVEVHQPWLGQTPSLITPESWDPSCTALLVWTVVSRHVKPPLKPFILTQQRQL